MQNQDISPWWHPYYRLGVREWVRPEEEIGPQLQALGIQPADIRWLVLTHLHTDHAGGLHHFPKVEILVSRTEYQQATGTAGLVRGGDTSYTQQFLLDGVVDGVSESDEVTQQTIQRIQKYLHSVPTICLPSRDPEAVIRLTHRSTAPLPSTVISEGEQI